MLRSGARVCRWTAAVFVVGTLASAPTQAQTVIPPEGPGGGTGGRTLTTGTQSMVVTANPLATQAGADILDRGGTAVDAMVAIQAVLGLVEPQSSGIGGGAFMVYYDANTRKVTSFDARETAPAAATDSYWVQANGSTYDFTTAWISGKSTGVPGVPKLLDTAHARYGKLPWASLFGAALGHATNGFTISARWGAVLAADNPSRFNAAGRSYFYKSDGTPKAVGTTITNPDYALTLLYLARFRSAPFYTGAIARDIITTTQAAPLSSVLNLDDFASYKVVERSPVCGTYRTLQVCGMGPPSSGGTAVVQILGLLERFNLTSTGVNSLDSVHLFTQANRLAFADRNQYLGDPDFVSVPVAGLIDKTYLAARSALIDPTKDMGVATFGTPTNLTRWTMAPGTDEVGRGTSHVSIIDKYGNALAMTTTVESQYGSHQMVRGFLLNNQLTDFNFSPNSGGLPTANRVEPRKRPRSSMSPTIIMDANNNVRMVTGTPGGAAIIAWTTQTIIAVLDWGLDAQSAVNLPHFLNNNGGTNGTQLEAGTSLLTLRDALLARGHSTAAAGSAQTSGLSVIVRDTTSGALQGGADPRRENLAIGR